MTGRDAPTADTAADGARGAGDEAGELAGSIRAVRLGHGANCSSIGSVIDTLFATAAIGGAVLAAIAAAMKSEPVRVAGCGPAPADRAPAEDDDAEGPR